VWLVPVECLVVFYVQVSYVCHPSSVRLKVSTHMKREPESTSVSAEVRVTSGESEIFAVIIAMTRWRYYTNC